MSTIKVDTVRPVTTDASLTLQGDSSGSGVTGITIDSSGVADFPNGLTLNSSTSLDGVASISEINGTHTTGSITSGTTSLTVTSGTGISNGDYIVGRGITPGTTVSSGGGTTSITLSANAGETLSSEPVAFYPATKVLTAGNVAGMLCRAWVNFDGTGTVAIRASGNVSSITDNGTGDYIINFTTAMPDANYSVTGLARPDSATAQQGGTVRIGKYGVANGGELTTTTARLTTTRGTSTSVDSPIITVAFFR